LRVTDALWAKVCENAINDTHTVQGETVAVWNGKQACLPGNDDKTVWDDGMASLNSWSKPDYRRLDVEDGDQKIFDDFLQRIFKEKADRVVFVDWLSWALQNEHDKPTWSILLYSQTKGTGKSTLGRLLSLLFGTENSMALNGVTKLTGRFNKTVMTKKFVICEEVKLSPGTDAGNTVKALISEKEIAVEGKGTNTESLENVCVYLMTSNHYPHWIEPDDRRFYVIDVDHAGNASGDDHEEFQAFMTVFYDYMSKPENVAKLYNSLMDHKQSNSFDARSLNIAAVDTKIMQRINHSSGQVLQQVLEEIVAKKEVYAIPQSALVDIFTKQLRANPNRITHMMNELGWFPQKAKWGGIDYRRVVWVHPDYHLTNGRVTGPSDYDEPVAAFDVEVEIL